MRAQPPPPPHSPTITHNPFQWTALPHQLQCRNVSCLGCNASTVVPSGGSCPHNLPGDPAAAAECAGNGALFNGMVAPFANMTVKGFVWCEHTCPCICV